MRLLLAALALPLLSAPPDPTPEALLAAIRQSVRQNLTRLRDYTCRLTIERSSGAAVPDRHGVLTAGEG
jgi:hypothetical protein